MGYLKMQGGEWLVTGRCSSPKFRRVGKNHTPFCTVGIAAGTNPKELDEQGRPKPIWINITAWRGAAELLATAHSGDARPWSVGRCARTPLARWNRCPT